MTLVRTHTNSDFNIGTTHSCSATVSGSDTLLCAFIILGFGASAPSNVMWDTDKAMTQVIGEIDATAVRYYFYYIFGPSAKTANVSCDSADGSVGISTFAYSGASQTIAPTNVGLSFSGFANYWTAGLTTVYDGSELIVDIQPSSFSIITSSGYTSLGYNTGWGGDRGYKSMPTVGMNDVTVELDDYADDIMIFQAEIVAAADVTKTITGIQSISKISTITL